MTTNENEESIYTITETVNHNNKTAEGSSKTDAAINDLTYNKKSLGNDSKENHQTRITKQFKNISDNNDSATLRQKGKVVVLKKLKHPSNLRVCRRKHQ